MTIDKNTTAVVIALITGIAGMATAFYNRSEAVTYSEAKSTYTVTTKSLSAVAEDVDANAARIQYLERLLIEASMVKIKAVKTEETGEPTTALPPPKRESRRTSKRAETPDFNASQSAPIPPSE